MYRKILVPLDGSALAEAVLPHATELARRFEAEVTLLQVVSLPSSLLAGEPTAGAVMDPIMLAEQLEAEAQAAQEYLDRKAAQLQSQGVKAHGEVRRGGAAEEIVRHAKGEGVGLIAMSTHGRSGLGRLVFGSVADQVLRQSGMPILLIKARGSGEG